MALNRRLKETVSITATVPVGTVSGDPVILGLTTSKLPGVAVTDRDADGEATVERDGSFDLQCKAIDSSGNSAIAKYDPIYYHDADTPKLSKKATSGILYGWANSTLASGATGTVEVVLERR